MVLIGQKCHREEKRQVQTDEGRKLAEQLHCPFFEISGRNGTNMVEAICELVRVASRENRR